MTRDELENIKRLLPGVKTRWGIAKDLANGVLAIDAITGGRWTEKDFRRVLATRSPMWVMVSAVCEQTGRVRGFACYWVEDYTNGTGHMTVANMAALDPLARRAVIEWLKSKSEKHNRELRFVPPTY